MTSSSSKETRETGMRCFLFESHPPTHPIRPFAQKGTNFYYQLLNIANTEAIYIQFINWNFKIIWRMITKIVSELKLLICLKLKVDLIELKGPGEWVRDKWDMKNHIQVYPSVFGVDHDLFIFLIFFSIEKLMLLPLLYHCAIWKYQ